MVRCLHSPKNLVLCSKISPLPRNKSPRQKTGAFVFVKQTIDIIYSSLDIAKLVLLNWSLTYAHDLNSIPHKIRKHGQGVNAVIVEVFAADGE